MIVYVIQEIGGNESSPDSLNVMANYHYHIENRVITWKLPSMVYTCVMWISAIPRKAGAVQGISPRELVTGRAVNYKRDCRACIGGYAEAGTDAIVTNDNMPCTQSCITLGPSGNRQGYVKCFDLEMGRVAIRRTINQIP